MTPSDLEAWCDQWLAAWTGDPERLLSFYAEDAYYEDPARPEGIVGHAALRPYLTKLLLKNPGWEWRRKRLWPIAEGGGARGCVVAHEARIPIGAGTLVERCMDLVLLDDQGRITRNEVYFDRARWLEALLATRRG